jgi:hypothetical protein
MQQRLSSRRARSWVAALCVTAGTGLLAAPNASAITSAQCDSRANDTPSKLVECVQTADLWNHMQAFQAIADAKQDPQLYASTLQAIKDRLVRQHKFALPAEDVQKIEYIFNVFYRGGPRMDYGFASTAPNPYVPSYHMLAVSTDGRGKNWVYLNREESYRHIRDMQQKNLIVPLV